MARVQFAGWDAARGAGAIGCFPTFHLSMAGNNHEMFEPTGWLGRHLAGIVEGLNGRPFPPLMDRGNRQKGRLFLTSKRFHERDFRGILG